MFSNTFVIYFSDSIGFNFVIFLTKMVDEKVAMMVERRNIATIERGLNVKTALDPRNLEMVNMEKKVNPSSSIDDKAKEINVDKKEYV